MISHLAGCQWFVNRFSCSNMKLNTRPPAWFAVRLGPAHSIVHSLPPTLTKTLRNLWYNKPKLTPRIMTRDKGDRPSCKFLLLLWGQRGERGRGPQECLRHHVKKVAIQVQVTMMLGGGRGNPGIPLLQKCWVDSYDTSHREKSYDWNYRSSTYCWEDSHFRQHQDLWGACWVSDFRGPWDSSPGVRGGAREPASLISGPGDSGPGERQAWASSPLRWLKKTSHWISATDHAYSCSGP